MNEVSEEKTKQNLSDKEKDDSNTTDNTQSSEFLFIDKLMQDNATLLQQIEDYKEKWLRSESEYRNLIISHKREIDNIQRFSLQIFVKHLLPVVDSLESALKQHQDDDLSAGLTMTLELLLGIFSNFNITVIMPIVGDIFVPDEHHAIKTSWDSQKSPNTISEVIQRGFKIHSRVIRPASVIVNIQI
jgi:molecular chaperone GrpE